MTIDDENFQGLQATGPRQFDCDRRSAPDSVAAVQLWRQRRRRLVRQPLTAASRLAITAKVMRPVTYYPHFPD
jgi:hypothetical protein